MRSQVRGRRLLLLAGIAVIALFLAGLVTGAIGNAFFGGEGEAGGLLPKPEVRLPAEPVFQSAESEGGHEGGGSSSLPAGKFLLTNTILSSWIATLVIVLLFVLATRRLSLVPRGIQNFMEAVVVALLGFVEGMAGKERARRFFPVIATIFLFVVVNAWLGLLPIYPSLGFLKEGHIERHLLRPAGTDLNMPLALALVSFIFVEYWGFRTLKGHYVGKFVRLGNLIPRPGRGWNPLQGLIDLFVGGLEALSELVRIVSFTFRLFGNMTAGEILLLVATFLVPFVFVIPFYGLEILVGFVQALIFAGLTLAFVTMAVMPHEEEGHGSH
ncbi:MAG: F0F1 ATP synthase subunit A [Chloroflexi bacterium]|nr:F0F1 ATP synthase subunit A [Chloroflexota bacterium]